MSNNLNEIIEALYEKKGMVDIRIINCNGNVEVELQKDDYRFTYTDKKASSYATGLSNFLAIARVAHQNQMKEGGQ